MADSSYSYMINDEEGHINAPHNFYSNVDVNMLPAGWDAGRDAEASANANTEAYYNYKVDGFSNNHQHTHSVVPTAACYMHYQPNCPRLSVPVFSASTAAHTRPVWSQDSLGQSRAGVFNSCPSANKSQDDADLSRVGMLKSCTSLKMTP
jgi:hypothetical protein